MPIQKDHELYQLRMAHDKVLDSELHLAQVLGEHAALTQVVRAVRGMVAVEITRRGVEISTRGPTD